MYSLLLHNLLQAYQCMDLGSEAVPVIVYVWYVETNHTSASLIPRLFPQGNMGTRQLSIIDTAY